MSLASCARVPSLPRVADQSSANPNDGCVCAQHYNCCRDCFAFDFVDSISISHHSSPISWRFSFIAVPHPSEAYRLPCLHGLVPATSLLVRAAAPDPTTRDPEPGQDPSRAAAPSPETEPRAHRLVAMAATVTVIPGAEVGVEAGATPGATAGRAA